MKAVQKGFLTLELLLATTLTGLVISAAMEAYRQVLGVEQKVNRKNFSGQNLQRLKERLALDTSSAFIPKFQQKQDDPKTPPKETKKDPDEQKQTKKPEDKQNDVHPEGSGFFYAQGEDVHFNAAFDCKLARTKTLSFCATSPIVFGHESPSRVARVTYLLEESKIANQKGKELFDLYRVETEDLSKTPDKKDLEQVYKMLLIQGLEEFSVHFVPGIEPNLETKAGMGVEVLLNWGPSEQEKYTIPEQLIFRLALEIDGKTKNFEVISKVYSFESKASNQKTTQEDESEKENDPDKEKPSSDEKPKDTSDEKSKPAENKKAVVAGDKADE